MDENTRALCESQRDKLADMRAEDEASFDLVITSYYAGYKQGQARAQAAETKDQRPA